MDKVYAAERACCAPRPEGERHRVNWDLLATYVARAVALLTAIPVHESAHAWASDKLGDPTAKRYGRLSLNPLRHFDFWVRFA